jgi:hypothetical protein
MNFCIRASPSSGDVHRPTKISRVSSGMLSRIRRVVANVQRAARVNGGDDADHQREPAV